MIRSITELKDLRGARVLGIATGQKGEITNETDQAKLWSLEEIVMLLRQQMHIDENGKIVDGALLSNGKPNVFYIKTNDNFVKSFWLFWDEVNKKWHINSLNFPTDWNFGSRIFSRN
jgi:hypothetical protein